jgi:phosphate transport system substrate-binding protein
MIVLISLILSVPVSAQELPPVNPAGVQGDIRISGVEVLQPLTDTLASRFALDGYVGSLTINTVPAAEAFTALCNGSVDIVMAGRQISSEEANLCESQQRAPLRFRVATSAIVLVVSPQNTLVNDINVNEIQQIYGSGAAWSEIRPNWPAEPINRYGPPTTSDEFAFFAGAAFGGNDRALRTAFNSTYSADLGAMAQNISNNRLAVGFFGLPFVTETNVSLRRLSIGGIAPTQNTIVSGNYALSRPLFLYSTDATLRDLPQVGSFLNYYLANLRQQIGTQAIYPPSARAYNAALNTWFQFAGDGDSQIAPQPTVAPQPTAANPTPTRETDDVAVIEPEPQATPTPEPATGFQEGALPLLASARNDLERLADDIFEGTERPAGWEGSRDTDNQQFPVLLRLDLETLAAVFYGLDTRPDTWTGAVSSTQLAIARDIRHDLEVLAQDYYGGVSEYPSGWDDIDPVLRCARSTVNLVDVVRDAGFELQVNPATPGYCREVEVEASRFAEVNLLLPEANFGRGGNRVQIAGDIVIDTRFGVGFFDRNGRQKAGVIPQGTRVEPIARSFVQFSNMTLVQGPDFLLFVDWLDTSLTSEQFRTLPDVNTVAAELYCSALWCSNTP